MSPTYPLENLLATQSRAVKTRVLSEMTSRQWHNVPAEIRERAFFSSQVTIAELMDELGTGIDSILNPQPGDRFHEGTDIRVTEGMNQAEARLNAKTILREISYQPAEGTEGTIQDLSSDGRLNLIIDTNVQMAQGYGSYMRAQDPDATFTYPAQELYRAQSRETERDWPQRWSTAAVEAQDGDALRVLTEHGLMIARLDSGVWEALGSLFEDGLGNPYPPFAFRSGMSVRPVSRGRAVELGIVRRGQFIEPQTRGFNETLQQDASSMSAGLQASLMEVVSPVFKMGADGIIRNMIGL